MYVCTYQAYSTSHEYLTNFDLVVPYRLPSIECETPQIASVAATQNCPSRYGEHWLHYQHDTSIRNNNNPVPSSRAHYNNREHREGRHTTSRNSINDPVRLVTRPRAAVVTQDLERAARAREHRRAHRRGQSMLTQARWTRWGLTSEMEGTVGQTSAGDIA